MQKIASLLLLTALVLVSACKSEKVGKGFLPGTEWDVSEYYIYFSTLENLNQTTDLSAIKGVVANEHEGTWAFSEDGQANIVIDYHFDALPYAGRGTYTANGALGQEERQSFFTVTGDGGFLETYHIHQRESRKDIWVKWESGAGSDTRVHMVHLLR